MNSQTNIPKPKDLPYNVGRGDIYMMYNHLSVEVITKQLDVLINAYCKVAQIPAKHFRKIPRTVWIEFIKINGFPEKYEPKWEWLEEKSID